MIERIYTNAAGMPQVEKLQDGVVVASNIGQDAKLYTGDKTYGELLIEWNADVEAKERERQAERQKINEQRREERRALMNAVSDAKTDAQRSKALADLVLFDNPHMGGAKPTERE